MKILHIISGGDKGGAKTHMFALLDELCKLADVTVVCLMRGVFYEEILERDVNTVLFEQKSRFDFSVVSKIADLVREGGYDIINSHGARANFICKRLIKMVDVPIVTTIHSDYKLDFDTFYKKLIFENLNISALKKIRYKIAVSDAFREMLISRGFMPGDVLTVYNGMDFSVPIDPMPKEEFAKKYGIPYDPETVYIGIAARFDHVKGVDVFIRAAAEVKAKASNVRFIIAGEGEDGESLKELAASLGIADIVHFVGFVSPIYDFLNFIDINSLTSRCESFPYSILEGARVAKPTVAAAVGGIPHLIKDDRTGYVFPLEDHSACAKKFLRFVESREKREQLGQALYQKASTEFSNLALAKQYLANYESFIRKHKREKRYDVVLSGYYGFDNFGDEMILDTIITSLRERRPGTEIAVLSRKPQKTIECFDVDAYDRFNPLVSQKVLKQCSTFVNGGGTLFTDITSTRSLLYYSYINRKAQRRGLKTMILANGIGPFRKKGNMKRAIKVFKNTDVITVRDSSAYNFIRTNLPGKDVTHTADVTFVNRQAKEGAVDDSIVAEMGIPTDRDYFIISLRNWRRGGEEFEKMIAASCDAICKKYDITPVFLPMQYEKDIDTIVSVAMKMKCRSVIVSDKNVGLSKITDLISHSRFVFAMRLHALIFAAACSRPSLGIAYDIKVSNFVKENKTGVYLSPDELSEERIVRELDAIASAQSSPAAGPLGDLNTRALQNIDMLIELIDRK